MYTDANARGQENRTTLTIGIFLYPVGKKMTVVYISGAVCFNFIAEGLGMDFSSGFAPPQWGHPMRISMDSHSIPHGHHEIFIGWRKTRGFPWGIFVRHTHYFLRPVMYRSVALTGIQTAGDAQMHRFKILNFQTFSCLV